MFLLVQGVCSSRAVADLAPGSEKELRAIADGYRANYESFPVVSCEFQIHYGQANSVDEAIKGGQLQNLRIANGLWIQDHEKLRYEIEEDPSTKPEEKKREPEPIVEKLPATPGSKRPRIVNGFVRYELRIDHYRILLEGNRGVHYNVEGGVAPIFSDYYPPDSTYDTPFTFAAMAKELMLHHYIPSLAEDRNATCAYGGIEQRADGDLKVINISYDRIDAVGIRQFLVDPKRGFLPIEMRSDLNKRFAHITRICETKEFSGNRSFPTRIVQIRANADAPEGPCEVRDFRVTELAVDAPSDPEQFAITIKKGTQINNPAIKVDGSFNLPETRTVTFGDINDLLARTLEEKRISEMRREQK